MNVMTGRRWIVWGKMNTDKTKAHNLVTKIDDLFRQGIISQARQTKLLYVFPDTKNGR